MPDLLQKSLGATSEKMKKVQDALHRMNGELRNHVVKRISHIYYNPVAIQGMRGRLHEFLRRLAFVDEDLKANFIPNVITELERSRRAWEDV